jgi:hypothetical protein
VDFRNESAAQRARIHPLCAIATRQREYQSEEGVKAIVASVIGRKLSGPEFCVDANRVNARGKLSAMNQLEKWHADGHLR